MVAFGQESSYNKETCERNTSNQLQIEKSRCLSCGSQRSRQQTDRIGNGKSRYCRCNLYAGACMNAVGIDVSKGKSMVAVLRSLGVTLVVLI